MNLIDLITRATLAMERVDGWSEDQVNLLRYAEALGHREYELQATPFDATTEGYDKVLLLTATAQNRPELFGPDGELNGWSTWTQDYLGAIEALEVFS